MKEKYSCRTDTFILISGGKLLKYAHITELQLVVLVNIVMKPCEKPVLVKIIIDDLLPEVYKDLVGHDERKSALLKSFFTQGKL